MSGGIVGERFSQDDAVLRHFTSNSETSCLRDTERIAVAATDGRVKISFNRWWMGKPQQKVALEIPERE